MGPAEESIGGVGRPGVVGRPRSVWVLCLLHADAIEGDPPSQPMVGVPGTHYALWLPLHALDGLLCCDLSDRLFQGLFRGIRRKRANSAATRSADIESQAKASFFARHCRVILAY